MALDDRGLATVGHSMVSPCLMGVLGCVHHPKTPNKCKTASAPNQDLIVGFGCSVPERGGVERYGDAWG